MAVVVIRASNEVLDETGREDVVVRDPAVTDVSPGAVERLLAAAAADSTAATVSALRAPAVVPPPLTTMHPVVAAPVPGLVLVPRATLDLCGAGTLEEIAAAASGLGLVHLLAADVTATPAGPAPQVPVPHHALDRAVAAAEVRGRRMTVTVDGRAIGPYRAGTQVHALELIAALGRTDAVDLRVIVAHDIAEDARAQFAADPRVTTVTYEEAAHAELPKTDIVHRPSQFFTEHDLALLRPLGERMVITHQDLIAYRAPGRNTEPSAYEAVRLTTRLTLGGCDHVVFFTEAARADALRDDLVTAERSSVVPIGVDHHLARSAAPVAPAGFDPEPPYLLALGADLPHKNLPFARRLAAARLDMRLVTAGPGAELGQVGEAEKAYLLAHAAAVVYPTLYEGFGLIPFEAARAGVPCLFAPVSALRETLGTALATLVPWDVEASAAAVAPLLTDGEERTAHVAALRAVADGFTWDGVAAQLVDVYRRTLETPRPFREVDQADFHAAGVTLDELGHRYGVLQGEHLELRAAIGDEGMALVGPEGVLSHEDRRAMLSVVRRRALAWPLLAVIRLGHRVVRRLSG